MYFTGITRLQLNCPKKSNQIPIALECDSQKFKLNPDITTWEWKKGILQFKCCMCSYGPIYVQQLNLLLTSTSWQHGLEEIGIQYWHFSMPL